MSENHSVTAWIDRLKAGDAAAARAIWDRYFADLCAVAARKLGGAPRRVRDEDDLALSAIHALCAGAKDGRFRRLEDRDDLWQILVMLVSRKAANVRRQQADRHEAGESAVAPPGENGHGFDQALAGPPTQAFVETLCVFCREWLAGLEEKLREVALLKLAGHSNDEIARLRDRSVKTIERYLHMIRLKWDD